MVVTESLKVLAIGHDGGRQGAPVVLLEMLDWMLEHTDNDIRVFLHHDGPLRRELAGRTATSVLNPYHGSPRTVARIARRMFSPDQLDRLMARLLLWKLGRFEPDVAWVNSVASWRATELVVPPTIPRVLHVHELEWAIRQVGPESSELRSWATHFIAASTAVRDNLVERHGVEPERTTVVYSSIPMAGRVTPSGQPREVSRDRLGVGEDDILLVGCGRASRRKGVDLLPQLIRSLRVDHGLEGVRLLWIGEVSGHHEAAVYRDCERLGVVGAIKFIGPVDDPKPWMALGDVFVLSSREEPLGLVCLEAARCGLPTVCFREAGGAVEFVGDDAGRSVSPMDAVTMAVAVAELAASKALRDTMAERGRAKIKETFNVDRQAPVLADVLARVGGGA